MKSKSSAASEKGKSPAAASLSLLLRDMAGTRGFGALASDLAPEVLRGWAGKNIFRRMAARFIGRSMSKGFKKQSESAAVPHIDALLSDPLFAKRLGELLPDIANGAMDMLHSAVRGIESLTLKEKELFFDALMVRTGRGVAGEIITRSARIVNEIHKGDPEFFSRRIEKRAARLVEETDFGELKELVDGSRQDIIAGVRAVNAVLWQYPAKVVCLLSLVPMLCNVMIESMKESLAPMNSLAPDLLTDVVLTLVRDLDGKQAGMLVNEVSELIRKIHAGSALIGEPGKPSLPAAVSEKAEEVIGAVDVGLLIKAKSLFAELVDDAKSSILDIAKENPDLAREFVQWRFRSMQAGHRALVRYIEAVEALGREEEIAAELAKGIRGIDAQGIADTVGRLCAIMNDVRRSDPGVIREALSQIFSSLDPHETGETARWLVKDVAESIKPIAQELVPPVIHGIAELIDPDLYGSRDELRSAIASLKEAVRRAEAAE